MERKFSIEDLSESEESKEKVGVDSIREQNVERVK